MPKAIPAYNLHDFRALAKKRLPKGIFEYIDRGVEDEVALAENRAAFNRIKLRPHVLADVTGRSAATELCGNTWVKVSGQHRMSAQGYPWADMRPLVRGVVDARPDRVLWGSDWPHPNQYDEIQNDGDLIDAFAQWVPEEDLRRQILVKNPAGLYEFN